MFRGRSTGSIKVAPPYRVSRNTRISEDDNPAHAATANQRLRSSHTSGKTCRQHRNTEPGEFGVEHCYHTSMKTERPAVRLDTSLEWLSERLATIRTTAVVATVISASGSTYRKPGARMLLEADGSITGLLSGGCFEQDLREHAIPVSSSGVPRTVTYNMRGEDDLIFGIGTGCEGSMGIMLEPAPPGGLLARAITTASELSQRGEPVALAAIHTAPSAELGTRLWHESGQLPLPEALSRACVRALEVRQSQSVRWGPSSDMREAYIQVVLPPPAVLICGAGPDAEPLVAGFRALRYPVTVVDHRPAYANPAKFPGAAVLLGSAATLADRLDLNRYFAAVVMSHHMSSDADYLRALAGSSLEYIGLLGPRPRRSRLLTELGAAAAHIENRLRGPIGLDIGAVTPEGIALAILAEVHAVAAGHRGGHLASA
jgi:xanthine dehydrogenase accessory factor